MSQEPSASRDYAPALWEKITVAAVAVFIITLVGVLVLRNEPFADPNLVVVLRIVLSLAVGALGAVIPGFLNIDWKGQGFAIRAGGALALFVLTYVISPTVQERVLPPSPIKKTFKLSISIDGVEFCEKSTRIASSDAFDGEDAEAVITQAAAWVKKTLDHQYPRATKDLKVEPSVIFDEVNKAYKLQLDKDPLRQDFFWIFTEDGIKQAHLKLEKSPLAVEALIAKAQSEKGHDRVTQILLHSERPGYDLELIRVPVGNKAETRILKWLDKPLTVIVGSFGNEAVAEGLRNRLQNLGFAVGTPEVLKGKKRTYEKAFAPLLDPQVRLGFLREVRVDAYVSGAYTETAEPNVAHDRGGK